MEAYTNLDKCIKSGETVGCLGVDIINEAIRNFVAKNEVLAKNISREGLNGDGSFLVPHCFYGKDTDATSVLTIGKKGIFFPLPVVIATSFVVCC